MALAAHDLAVFPVAGDCRRPLTAHGCKDASRDAEVIQRWWSRWPAANLAVACGAVSGVFVLDVDVKGANGRCTLGELVAAHGELPLSWRTATPSGGLHVWFRQPARELRNRVGFAPGLDVRTDGGSVAVPPARKSSGCYRWEVAPWEAALANAPAWLLELIDPPPAARPPHAPIRAGSLDRLAKYAATAVNGECREVACTAAGRRNARLFRASARLGELVGAGLVPATLAEEELEAAAHDCGLLVEDGRRAVLATIKSGLTRGMAHPRDVRP
jgi:putative DNA primase/helicase